LKRTSRVWQSVLLTVCMLLGNPAMSASEQVMPQAVSQPKKMAPMTVLVMMQAESDVLAKWQSKQQNDAAGAQPAASLLSIYGVLPQLRATVLVNGREVVFEQGRKLPLNLQKSSLRLRLIKPPCVSFAQGAKLQTVCLPRTGL
jgi:hypothetical protein